MHPKNEFVKLTTYWDPTYEIPPVDYVMRPHETTLGPLMTIRTHNKLGFMGRKRAEDCRLEENREGKNQQRRKPSIRATRSSSWP